MTTANVFRVETVETCVPPRGVTQGHWCRYVVKSDSSRIVGRYRGSLSQAKSNAESLVKGLNSRAKTGKSPWVPRGRKPARAAAESQATD